jgi:hypothetical protein
MAVQPRTPAQPEIEPGAPKIMSIKVRDLYRDPKVNTREPGEAWIEQNSGVNFYRPAIGVLSVSLRDGSNPDQKKGPSVLDGWNRRELLMRNVGPDTEADCAVFQHLTLAQEAKMFLKLNKNRKVAAVPRFLAQVTALETIPVQVAAIIEQAGFTVATQRAPGTLVCVAEMCRLHQRDKDKCGSARTPQALLRTLTCIQVAFQPSDRSRYYGEDEAATHVSVVGGIGHLFLLWGDAADKDRMGDVLRRWNNGANGLLRQANGAQDVTPGLNTASRAVSYLVARAYNKGLSARALPVPFSK